GFNDVVVGAFFDDDNGQNSGSAYVYLGSTTVATNEAKLVASDGADEDYYGRSVSGAGDINGDGYDDIIVGAQNDDNEGDNSGSSYLYFGNSSGISPTTEYRLVPSDAGTSNQFGTAVAGAGDVNGDGYDDIIVGTGYGLAPGYLGGAYIFHGGSSGIDLQSETKLVSADIAQFDYFGSSVAAAGDVNGDGYSDVIIGAYADSHTANSAGSAYIFLGSANGIDDKSETKLLAPNASDDDFFGDCVAGAGDVNGDGYDDVIVGAWQHGVDRSGNAFVYLGSSSGIDVSNPIEFRSSDIISQQKFGISVAGAGDIDGDGYDDVIVGAIGDDDNGFASGAAYLFPGSSTGIDTSREVKLLASEGTETDKLGVSVAGAGDVNHDGWADVIVGAYLDQNGSAYVFTGNYCVDDTDGDGLTDCIEEILRSNPKMADTDGDTLSDGDEILLHGTSPTDDDSDDDGYNDGEELTAGSDPLDASSIPGSGEDTGDTDVDTDTPGGDAGDTDSKDGCQSCSTGVHPTGVLAITLAMITVAMRRR
ncbi:MAG: hypothetical protein HN348_23005, partial [Proteobacteria bacterium]|nr:hypothetical protein [Pseudomonadota bacterium]